MHSPPLFYGPTQQVANKNRYLERYIPQWKHVYDVNGTPLVSLDVPEYPHVNLGSLSHLKKSEDCVWLLQKSQCALLVFYGGCFRVKHRASRAGYQPRGWEGGCLNATFPHNMLLVQGPQGRVSQAITCCAPTARRTAPLMVPQAKRVTASRARGNIQTAIWLPLQSVKSRLHFR
jgi:hypothetical protein